MGSNPASPIVHFEAEGQSAFRFVVHNTVCVARSLRSAPLRPSAAAVWWIGETPMANPASLNAEREEEEEEEEEKKEGARGRSTSELDQPPSCPSSLFSSPHHCGLRPRRSGGSAKRRWQSPQCPTTRCAQERAKIETKGGSLSPAIGMSAETPAFVDAVPSQQLPRELRSALRFSFFRDLHAHAPTPHALSRSRKPP